MFPSRLNLIVLSFMVAMRTIQAKVNRPIESRSQLNRPTTPIEATTMAPPPFQPTNQKVRSPLKNRGPSTQGTKKKKSRSFGSISASPPPPAPAPPAVAPPAAAPRASAAARPRLRTSALRPRAPPLEVRTPKGSPRKTEGNPRETKKGNPTKPQGVETKTKAEKENGKSAQPREKPNQERPNHRAFSMLCLTDGQPSMPTYEAL